MSQGFNHNHTMMTAPNSIWFPRSLTFVVWALAAASAVSWGLRWGGQSHPAPPSAALAAPAPVVDSGVVARLLGSPGVLAAVVSAPSRFALAGVVAHTASRTGAALIAIDGKPAKAFTVGARVEEGLYLRFVQGRQAGLATSPEGQVSLTLELPAQSASLTTTPGGASAAAALTPAAPLDAAPRATLSTPAARPAAGRRGRSAGTDDTQD